MTGLKKIFEAFLIAYDSRFVHANVETMYEIMDVCITASSF